MGNEELGIRNGKSESYEQFLISYLKIVEITGRRNQE
jgi:hypothetical protein